MVPMKNDINRILTTHIIPNCDKGPQFSKFYWFDNIICINSMAGFYMKPVFAERCFWTNRSIIHIWQYLLSSFSYFNKLVFICCKFLRWYFESVLEAVGAGISQTSSTLHSKTCLLKTVYTFSTFGWHQKSFWDGGCCSRCSTKYLSSPIIFSSIHTTTHISSTTVKPV